jgi:hypothetical protein
MRLPHLVLALSLAAASAVAGAQNAQKSPPVPNAQANVNAAMESMLPMLEKMTDATIAAQLNAAAKPETAERIAAFKRNLYDALRKKGFTTAEALQIVLSTPLPGGQTSTK